MTACDFARRSFKHNNMLLLLLQMLRLDGLDALLSWFV